MCRCGHPLSQHTDRAVFPPCEGAWQFDAPIHEIEEGWFFKLRATEPACDCKGFECE